MSTPSLITLEYLQGLNKELEKAADRRSKNCLIRLLSALKLVSCAWNEGELLDKNWMVLARTVQEFKDNDHATYVTQSRFNEFMKRFEDFCPYTYGKHEEQMPSRRAAKKRPRASSSHTPATHPLSPAKKQRVATPPAAAEANAQHDLLISNDDIHSEHVPPEGHSAGADAAMEGDGSAGVDSCAPVEEGDCAGADAGGADADAAMGEGNCAGADAGAAMEEDHSCAAGAGTAVEEDYSGTVDADAAMEVDHSGTADDDDAEEEEDKE